MLYHAVNPHGGDIYGGEIRLDFSANTNPLGTPPAVRQAVAETLDTLDRYPDPYCRNLAAAIAAAEGVTAEEILCGAGAAELIYSFCAAAAPKRAVMAAPTFSEYALGLRRAEVLRYPLRQEDCFDLDGDFLPFLAEAQPEAIFLCSPNNPTGRLISPALLLEVLRWCRANGCRLLLDECFLDLTEGGETMRPYLTEFPELFLLRAFTKSYGMAGLRLGYGLCADGALLAAMGRTVQPWNVSAPAQAAGVAALGEGAFLERTRALLCRERPILKAGLEALGFWVCPGQANYLLLRGPKGLCGPLLRRGIGLRDCANYPGLGPGWYRTAVRTGPENQALLNALREVREELPWPEIL